MHRIRKRIINLSSFAEVSFSNESNSFDKMTIPFMFIDDSEELIKTDDMISTNNYYKQNDKTTTSTTSKEYIRMSQRYTKQQFSQQQSIIIPINYVILLFYIISIISALCVAGQCPWTKESIDLHSDCICDFNPSLTSNLDDRPVNRMSVQCSPVNFNHLLSALKQTASIELPNQLLKEIILSQVFDNNSTVILNKIISDDADELLAAGFQLASQAKLDLLHVSNSTIKQLLNNTFILEASGLTSSPASTTINDSQSMNSLTTMFANTNNNHTIKLIDELDMGNYLVVAIQSLHLSRCGIEKIDLGAFNGLEWSLNSLSLSDNYLEYLPNEALKRLINLKVLDMSNNKLLQLKANSFVTLTKLKTLRLADNKFGQYQNFQQQNSTSPSSSSSSLIQQQAINLKAFAGLEECLNDLNLKNTQLSSFPLAIKSLTKLAFLNLAQNQISTIPSKSFENINSLTAINLERNRISKIEDDTFLGIESSLSSLSLLGNLLEIFPVNQLSKLSSIRRLDMGFNSIEQLPLNSFQSNKQLILIALDGNPLETLPEEAFKPLQGTLRGMSIGGKVLNCDCRLSWMLRWQQEYNIQISSRERNPQFCSKPHYLRSLVSFVALKPEHLTCQTMSISNNNNNNSSANNVKQNWNSPYHHHHHSTQRQQTNSYHQFPETNTSPFTLPTSSQLNVTPTTFSSVLDNSMLTTTTTTSSENVDLTEAGSNLGLNDSTTINSITGELLLSSTLKPTLSYGDRLDNANNNNSIFLENQLIMPLNNNNLLNSANNNNINNHPTIPDEEMFLDGDGHEGQNSRKLNRHGFLPSTGVLKQYINNNNYIQQNQQLFAELSKSKNNDTQQASFRVQDLLRNSNNNNNNNNISRVVTTTIATNNNQGLQPSVAPIKPPKQIFSVFGNRAGDNSNKNRGNTIQSSPTTTLPETTTINNKQSNNYGILTSQQNAFNNQQFSSSIVPAVPTTINVYKTTLNNTITTSGHRDQLNKNARFVDELTVTSPSAPIKNNKLNSTIKPHTTTMRNRTTILPINNHQLIDTDIERFTFATSNIQSRIYQPQTTTPISQQTTLPATTISSVISSIVTTTTTPEPVTLPMRPTLGQVEMKRYYEPTTTLSYSYSSSSSSSPDNILEEKQYNQPTRPSLFANNTRMSVSSIYRMATKTSTTTTTTTPAPWLDTLAQVTTNNPIQSTISQQKNFKYVITNGGSTDNGLVAAAERETQKITRQSALVNNNDQSTRSNNMDATSRQKPSMTTTDSTSMFMGSSLNQKPTSTSVSRIVSTKLNNNDNYNQKKVNANEEAVSNKSNVETTTRMAATVRFVDSIGVPVFRLFQQQSSNGSSTTTSASTTSTTTTTTPMPMINEATKLYSSSVDRQQSSTGSFMTTQANLIKLDNISVPAKGSSAPIFEQQLNTVGTTPGLIVGEQQHETKLTLISSNSSLLSSFLANKQRTATTTNSGKALQTESQQQQQHQDNTGAEKINLITKSNFDQTLKQRQGREKDESLLFGSNLPQSKIFGRFIKLTDFDQLAIILASLLCLIILIVTLTIVCICYSSWLKNKRAIANATSRLSSFSSSLESSPTNLNGGDKSRQQLRREKLSNKPSFFSRFICCCLFKSSSSAEMKHLQQKRITPMRSLILQQQQHQDDDNSSGSSRNNLSKSTGKSMLLPSSKATTSSSSASINHHDEIMFESIRRISSTAAIPGLVDSKTIKRKKDLYNFDNLALEHDMSGNNNKPIDHKASIQMHKQAQAMDQEYFLKLTNNNKTNTTSRTIGRRKSMLLDTNMVNFHDISRQRFSTNVPYGGGWLSTGNNNNYQHGGTISSCDSDKSCSPGANKNNRYNINEAHRAYLLSNKCSGRDQVKASMFVTTADVDQPSNNTNYNNNNNHHHHHKSARKSGLLKTIEGDYFERLSRVSSDDKSTTDDSRAPLNGLDNSRRNKNFSNSGLDRMLINNSQQYEQATMMRNKSNGRSFGFPRIARSRSIGRLPTSVDNNINQFMNTTTDSVCQDDFMNSELVPISAEDQWPEPYIEPQIDNIEQQLTSFTSPTINNNNNTSSRNKNNSQHNNQQANNNTGGYLFNNDNNGTQTYNRRGTNNNVAVDNFPYNDAYLANWHTVSRTNNKRNNQSEIDLIKQQFYSPMNNLNNERINNQQQQQQTTNGMVNLVKYKSIPNLINATNSNLINNQNQQQQRQNSFLGNHIAGATNWLRWTPTSNLISSSGLDILNDSSTRRDFNNTDISPISSADTSTGIGASRDVTGRSWHRDNQVEALYVSSNNQQR